MLLKSHFREYSSKRIIFFPERLDKDIPKDDPVRVIDEIIECLKLDNLIKLYKERGRSPYDPKMMLKAVIYGYMNNFYSCRKIANALKYDIRFIWLAGYEQPDHNTINRFRNRVKSEIDKVFTQIVLILADKGYVSLDVEYIDGTKIESKANKYTFVWRKTTTQNREKLLEKVRVLLEQIDDAIAQEHADEEKVQSLTPEEIRKIAADLNESLQKSSAPQTKEQEAERKAKEKDIEQLVNHADKLEEYNQKLDILGDRNSYSKTDHDATFMRMKEDQMNNGQTKPGYNLQIGTENQFILDFGLFPNPGDTLTMIPFFNTFHSRYDKLPMTAVADAGYGSEENYRFMDEHGIDAYVKYNMFHREQKPRYTPRPFSQETLYYNAEGDYYICPMGQKMSRIGTVFSKTDSGYITEAAQYKAIRCEGCPLRGACFKASGDRIIEVNHRANEYRRRARERLTSEEGIKHRGLRCIEPEAVFGQMKYNMAYKRFRHFGLDKVKMDFAFFAIAFNLKKMCSKMKKSANNGGNDPHIDRFLHISDFLARENLIFRIIPNFHAA